MSQMTTTEVEHGIEVLAPAHEVYRMLADVTAWPQIFPPTIHVERLEHEADVERIQIWATANDDVKTWTSRRRLDPAAMRIEFRQEVSAPPVAAMGGTWLIEPLSDGSAKVRLLHDFRAVDDDPAALEWIDQAVDRNSRSELAALKANVEAALAAGGNRVVSFEDSVRIDGSAEDVYDFLNEAHLWQERLPHVASVELGEPSPGLQLLAMETRAKDGSTHITKSVRVCFPGERIVYKQITLPALMTLHTGYWLLEPDADGGVRATSQHSIVINEANIAAVLGEDADLAQAVEYVRGALSANSRATLGYARAYAESSR